MSEVRHLRKNKSKQNNARAKYALKALAADYKEVKLAFVSGQVSKMTMEQAHAEAAQGVQAVRESWKKAQAEIDNYYENAVARTMTMENFVEQDSAKAD